VVETFPPRAFYLLDMKSIWKYRNDNDATDGGDDSPKIITLEKSSDSLPQGNRIYFYSDVNKDSILNLNRQIDDLTRQMKMIQFGFNLSKPPRIELHICSDGGDIFAGMATVDKIVDNPIPVDTYCEGMVASAATLLSSVGDRRYISKSSCMLIHQISSGLWGNYMQFKDEMKNLELLMSLVKSVYLKKTKFEKKELDELLNHDLCLGSQQCLDYGLVDEIL
jgi:ATP-dependent Clp endopeptidase proteolytic subunit ClpP